ncbi:TniQ family protein [Paenibacillus sp. IHB B 3415]|uniref:TniQ family protein n=1 Tax=Paenibacillus sp. IHB B 3415 TaxID=867080 RepID=UPI0035A1BD6C
MVFHKKTLIRHPKYIEGESLVSYTYRLSKENRYSGITNLAKNLNCPSSQINKNEFNHSMIRRLSQLSDNPIENLKSGSANTIRLMLGDTLYNHMIQRHRIKYCPICIEKGELRHRWYWSFYPYTVCLEHSVLLIDRCSFCQSYIGIKDNKIHKRHYRSQSCEGCPLREHCTKAAGNLEVIVSLEWLCYQK